MCTMTAIAKQVVSAMISGVPKLLVSIYGGHSAHLILHIIISELHCIILDFSPKILSRREKYLLGAFIYSGRVCLFWARLFVLGAFIYSIRLCSLKQTRMPVPDRQSTLQLS
jgi:hypothetical protein